MRDLPGEEGAGTGEEAFLVEAHLGLRTSGVCEIKRTKWWDEIREWARIYIRRPERQDTAGPAVEETCVLAHELGHYRSFQKIGFDEYDRLLKCRLMAEAETDGYKKMSAADRRMVWEEEVRAWELGRTELTANNFRWWQEFEAVKEASLETYRVGLGMADLA
jgi:hypothetical protein